jgi:hypothetical protein
MRREASLEPVIGVSGRVLAFLFFYTPAPLGGPVVESLLNASSAIDGADQRVEHGLAPGNVRGLLGGRLGARASGHRKGSEQRANLKFHRELRTHEP